MTGSPSPLSTARCTSAIPFAPERVLLPIEELTEGDIEQMKISYLVLSDTEEAETTEGSADSASEHDPNA